MIALLLAVALPLPDPSLLGPPELEAALMNMQFLIESDASDDEINLATEIIIGSCRSDSERLAGWLDYWDSVPAKLKYPIAIEIKPVPEVK